jgi:hypothetical protein
MKKIISIVFLFLILSGIALAVIAEEKSVDNMMT